MAARTKDGRKVTRSGRKPRPQAEVQPPVAAAAEPTQEQARPKRIRLITNLPTPEATQGMMGRQIRPFAKPAQSGTYAPFAVAQARRGH